MIATTMWPKYVKKGSYIFIRASASGGDYENSAVLGFEPGIAYWRQTSRALWIFGSKKTWLPGCDMASAGDIDLDKIFALAGDTASAADYGFELNPRLSGGAAASAPDSDFEPFQGMKSRARDDPAQLKKSTRCRVILTLVAATVMPHTEAFGKNILWLKFIKGEDNGKRKRKHDWYWFMPFFVDRGHKTSRLSFRPLRGKRAIGFRTTTMHDDKLSIMEFIWK